MLPQGVASATIAGLPPEYGLYAAMMPAIVAALFGSAGHLVSGPTTAISIAICGAIHNLAEPGTPEYVGLTKSAWRWRPLGSRTSAPNTSPAAATSPNPFSPRPPRPAADLIVLCRHTRSVLGRALMGSVSNEVLERAGVPVLLCGGEQRVGSETG